MLMIQTKMVVVYLNYMSKKVHDIKSDKKRKRKPAGNCLEQLSKLHRKTSCQLLLQCRYERREGWGLHHPGVLRHNKPVNGFWEVFHKTT